MAKKVRKKTGSSRYVFRVFLLLLLGFLILVWWQWVYKVPLPPRFNYMVIEKEGNAVKLPDGGELRLLPETPIKIERVSTNIYFNRGVRLVAEGFDINALRYDQMTFSTLLSGRDLFQNYRFVVSVKLYNRVIGSVQFIVQPNEEDWLERAAKIIDPPRRLEFLEKAHHLMPEDSLIRQKLITEYKNQKQYAAAARMIEDLNKKSPDQDLLLELYDLYQAMDNREGVIHTLKRLVALDPSNDDYQLRLAEVYQEAGKLNEAIKAYEKIFSASGRIERLNLLKILGFLYAKAGKTEKAISSFSRAADIDPKDSNLYYNLYALYEKIGQLKQANTYLQRAVALEKGDLENRLLLAERLIKSGDLEKANRYLDEILAEKNDSLKALFLKVKLLEKTNNKKELKKIYYRIQTLEPENETVTFNLGLLEYETGKLDQALKLFHEFIKKYPDDKQTHALLFDIYQQQKKSSQAFKEAMFMLRMDPKQVGLYTFIFDYLNTKKDYQQIREIMEAGLKNNPDNIDLRQYLILACLKTGDQDKAVEVTKDILKMQPDNIMVRLQLARLLENRGHLKEAMDSYKKILELSPGHKEAGEAYLRLRMELLTGAD